MRWLQTITIVVLAGPGAEMAFAQDSDSATVLRELGERVNAATSVKIVSNFKITGVPVPGVGTRTKVIGAGNKARMESNGTYKKSEITLRIRDIVISDGKLVYIYGGMQAYKDNHKPENVKLQGINEPIKPGFIDDLKLLTTFIGEGQSFLNRGDGEKGNDKPIAVTEIGPIKNDLINGRETLAITYKAKFHEMGRTVPTTYRVELWIDSKTRLPVKRTLTMLPDKVTKESPFVVEEVYSEFVLGVPVDAKLFQTPPH